MNASPARAAIDGVIVTRCPPNSPPTMALKLPLTGAPRFVLPAICASLWSYRPGGTTTPGKISNGSKTPSRVTFMPVWIS